MAEMQGSAERARGLLTSTQLAAALLETRRDTLDLVATLSETRIFRATDRDGWTVKHELAYLAAADRVLICIVDELRAAGGTDPIVIAATAADLRRLRGQQMHATQELRLGPLCEELSTLGEQTARAIEIHGELLGRHVALGGSPAPAIEHAHAHLERARAGADRIRASVG